MSELSTTFDAEQWTNALAGGGLDGASLLRWRLAPPAVPAPLCGMPGTLGRPWSHADVRKYIPVAIVAEQFQVTPAVILRRCRRWGIPVVKLMVGARPRPGGGACPIRRSFLTSEALRALTVRSVIVVGGGCPGTSRETSAPSTGWRRTTPSTETSVPAARG